MASQSLSLSAPQSFKNKKKAKVQVAMDIGTNSTRLLILSQKKIIYQAVTITRIGEGLKDSKKIQEIPLQRTIDALQKYKEKISQFEVENYHLVATSAMRDALNKDQVVEKIQKETGFFTKIISGQEEAELSYLGATADFPGKNIVIDIGGGSTEVVFPQENPQNQDNNLIYTSTNLGGVRLKENPQLLEKASFLFSKNIPQSQKQKFQNFDLIGVGGTITTLAAVKLAMEEYRWEKIHGLLLTIEEIRDIHKKLKGLSLLERQKVPGLEPERADIILHGIDILLIFMGQYDFKAIRVSDKDLLFALVTNFSQRND